MAIVIRYDINLFKALILHHQINDKQLFKPKLMAAPRPWPRSSLVGVYPVVNPVTVWTNADR